MLNVRVGEKTICLMFWVRSEHMDWYKSLPAPSLGCSICHWPLIDKNSNHMAYLSCCNDCPNVLLTKKKKKNKKKKPKYNNTFKSRQKRGVINTWVHTLSQEKGCLLGQSEDRQITLILQPDGRNRTVGLRSNKMRTGMASIPVPQSRLFLS